jgi:hypothetical protein
MGEREQALAVRIRRGWRVGTYETRLLRAELRELAGELGGDGHGSCCKCEVARMATVASECEHYYAQDNECSGFPSGACCACLCGESEGE